MHGLSLIGKSYVVSLLWCKVHVTQGKEFERMNEILLSSSEYSSDKWRGVMVVFTGYCDVCTVDV